MALSLLSTAQQNQQNQLEREGLEEKEEQLVPVAEDTVRAPSPQLTPAAPNQEPAANIDAVKEEAVIPIQGENTDTLPEHPPDLPSTHKQKHPVESPCHSEEPDVTDDNSGKDDEASSSRPTTSLRTRTYRPSPSVPAKKTRFLSKYIPNEEQNDYEKRKEYFSAITKDIEEVGTHILGCNGLEFLILVIEEDQSQKDEKKTKETVNINMVKAKEFAEVFHLIRAELNYRNHAKLKKTDMNTWIEDAFNLEKEQRESKFIFPPTFFARFSDVLKKILDYEQNKKISKEKRAEAGRIHEVLLEKLDGVAESLGYCCGQKRCVVFEGYDEPYPEPEIRCRRCWKEFHVQCVFWNSIVDGSASEFVCRSCSPRSRRPVNMDKLQKTPSTIFIEDGINEFLGALENVPEVPGRMSCRLFVCLRSEEMSDHDKQRFPGIYELMDKVPRTFKIYGVTQEHQGQAVLIYLMAVNEYCKGSGVPKHKEGLVSFEFIDTVKYLNPHHKSREINQKLLRLYLQNAQQRGFHKARIHASSPGSREYDFMFNNRPLFKKNLAQQDLFDWYKENVEKLVVDMKRVGVQMTYKHVFDPANRRTAKTICEELYMAEGFWPVFLERNHKTPIKIFKEMVKRESESRDNCQFYIRFEDQREVKIVTEEDPFIASTIAASRSVWVYTQRENTWLFDTLRHAKFATMMLLSTLEMEREPEGSVSQLPNETENVIDEDESGPSTSRT